MPRDRSPPATGRGHAQIADRNARAILEALRRNGAMTRLELATLTGLTAPGVTNIIRRHLADGLVVEGHRKNQNAQIPSAEYALKPDGAFAIGIRLREECLQAVLIDLSGGIRLRRDAGPWTGELGDIVTLVEQVTADAGEAANIVGVGLALGAADDIDIRALGQQLPHIQSVTAELDTIAAVLAERTIGAGVPDDGLIMVLMEKRIRAGLFLHSIPFAGVRGKAGRLGEMRTGRDRLALDDVCSTDAFEAAVAGRSGVHRASAIAAWVDNAAEHLLDAMMALAGFVAPGKIVFSGDLPADVVANVITKVLKLREKMLMDSPAPVMPPVAAAAFPHDSVLRGAALLPFFDMLLPRPFAGS
jgi:predicted NBD/HSP70 family sugar kinase